MNLTPSISPSISISSFSSSINNNNINNNNIINENIINEDISNKTIKKEEEIQEIKETETSLGSLGSLGGTRNTGISLGGIGIGGGISNNVREVQLSLEREKLIKQQSLNEEKKIKNEKMKKELNELRNNNKINSNEIFKSSSSSSLVDKKGNNLKNQSLNGIDGNEKKLIKSHNNSNKDNKDNNNKKEKDNNEVNHITSPSGLGTIPTSTIQSTQSFLSSPSTPSILSPRDDIFETKEIENTTTTPPISTTMITSSDNPEHFPLLILENCQIIDVESGELSPNHHIIISLDGRIESMGIAPYIHHIKSWMRYDCQNYYILPGLCDAHTNITVPSDISINYSTKSSSSYRAIASTHILKTLLHCGFTTIRDSSGVDSGIIQAINENLLDSPRILSSGMAIGPKGTFLKSTQDNILNSSIYSCQHLSNCNHKCSSWCGWNVESGESQLRDYIQSLVQSQNISQLSIVHGNYCYDSFLSPTTQSQQNQSISGLNFLNSSIIDREYPIFSRSEYDIISEECSLINLPIMATCNTKIPIQRAINIGAKCIDGGLEINDEIAQQIKESNCSIVPILTTSFILGILKNYSQNPLQSSLSTPLSPPQLQISQNSKNTNQNEENLIHNNMSSSGTLENNNNINQPYVNSTQQQLDYYRQWTTVLSLSSNYDINLVYGSNLHSNQYLKSVPTILSWYLQSSLYLSPVQLLRSLTCSAANLFNLNGIIGTISIGAIADLIMVQSNPLIDNKWYNNEESVCVVIQRGRIKKLHRSFRENLYLLDEETQEISPMITQETIGRKFTYGINSTTKDKRKPWKPPGPVIPLHNINNNNNNNSNHNINSNLSTTTSSSNHSHGYHHQLGRSLSSASVSTKGEN